MFSLDFNAYKLGFSPHAAVLFGFQTQEFSEAVLRSRPDISEKKARHGRPSFSNIFRHLASVSDTGSASIVQARRNTRSNAF